MVDDKLFNGRTASRRFRPSQWIRQSQLRDWWADLQIGESERGTAVASASGLGFSEAVQSWHDFYLMLGAAAATLAGLLFVGLSLHIRVVVSHPDVRALARVTLTDFIVIVLIALAVLAPENDSIGLFYWMVSLGVTSLVLIARPALSGIGRSGRRAIDLRTLVVRFGLSAFAFVAGAGTGVLFATGDYRDGLIGLVPVAVLLLIVAVRNTWDLLVTIADRSGAI